MTSLPVVSSRQAIAAFIKAGWELKRIAGSHCSLRKAGSPNVLTVPLHQELPRGTLRALIRLAGLSIAEFVRLL